MKKPKPKRKRLVRGKDWHAYCWKSDKQGLCQWADYLPLGHAEDRKPEAGGGHWVRVKFVEVKP